MPKPLPGDVGGAWRAVLKDLSKPFIPIWRDRGLAWLDSAAWWTSIPNTILATRESSPMWRPSWRFMF